MRVINNLIQKFIQRSIGSEKLMEVDVKVISNKECIKTYEKADDETKILFPNLYRNISSLYAMLGSQAMCTYTPGKDGCQGDSGGPLFTAGWGNNGVEPGQNYELIGLSSFGINCADFPGVWSRVSAVLEWIKKTTRFNESECPRK